MAARASCTEAGALRRPSPAAGGWWACALGMAWGHASLAALALASPLLAAGGAARGAQLATSLFAWSLLLPAGLTAALFGTTADPLSALAATGLPWYALPVPALVGAALGSGWARLTRGSTTARLLARVTLAGGLLVAAGSGSAALAISAQERAAERLFLRMVAGDAPPWQVPASRSAARELAHRYPGTRWASEAWRVLATDAEMRGSRTDAASAWRSFEACFGDEDLPGRALAALGIARALEGSVPGDEVASHYLSARLRVARTSPHTQEWIATQAAHDLARLSRKDALYATARYWESKATSPAPDRSTRDGG